jgi:hypothetical protein
VLKAAGESETTQENIQDWLQLDEEDPGFEILTEEEIAAVILYLFFISTTYIIKFSNYIISKFYGVLEQVFAPDNNCNEKCVDHNSVLKAVDYISC